MHVVIVDGDVSYPATSGKRLRTLNLLLKAATRQRITYVGRCAEDSEEARLAPAFLRDHGIEPILVHHPVPKKTGPTFYARLFANLFSSSPYTVTSHLSGRMRSVVSDFASRERVDVWQVEWPPYLASIDASIPGPRVAVAHNVDTRLWQRYYETEKNAFKRAFFKVQWHRFRRFEETAFRQAARVVAVTEEDACYIRETFGQPHVDVVDNGIDRAFFEHVEGPRDPSRILYLGALDWWANLDAVGLLLDRIFPRVRSLEPNAMLVIVGRHPPAALVERVRHTPGVELHADVGDVRPYLGGSGVMAVPLRIGGGSRLKILEALASGLPVVASTIGAEGLRIRPGVDFVRADEADMADALVRAIRKPGDMQAMAQRGRALVLDTYDWDVLAQKLETSWEHSLGMPATRG
ncbi:MAG: glycosyltransferase family 4 protein [Acidobacteria bacterium]|nr:glycosyltransferase family 4 protein [Acidobacteriota bacterium]